MVMGMVESLAVSQMGAAAAYSDTERATLLYGLSQMFEHAEAKALDDIKSILWPGAIIIGAVLYGSRMYRLYQAQHAEPWAQPPDDMPVRSEQNGNPNQAKDPKQWLNEQIQNSQRGVL